MNTHIYRLWSMVLAGALGIAAAAPVAMRVELEPLRRSGAATEVRVMIQVSPEDRGRIGDNVILRVELDGGAISSGSPMRALRLEDDGSASFIVAWPPGEHDLRVQIEDRVKQNTGLWVGKVRIPDLSAGQASLPEPEPRPEPEPPPAAGSATAATAPPPQPSEPPAPSVAEREDATDQTAADSAPPSMEQVADDAVAVTAAAAAEPTEELKPSEPAAPGTEEGSAAVAAVEPEQPPAAVEPAPAPAVEATPLRDQPEETSAAIEEEQSAAEGELTPTAEEEPGEALPIVEPLRSDTAPDVVETAPPMGGGPPAPPETGALLPDAAAARIDAWDGADPATREIPVVVMTGREPVVDVERDALQLRVDGSDVPIEKLGGADSAPLLLGLAVDVATSEIQGWAGAQGALAPLAERAAGGRGELFVASDAGVGGWNAEPEAGAPATAAASSGNVARLVVAALEPFQDRRGRTFLVVLTDGRNEPSKAEWADATDAASAAGVPILVVALWDDEFSHRTRKNLKQLTVVSGGSLFLVQGAAQLDSAADRFGRLLDGSYALRFRSAAAAQGGLRSISVTASDRKLDVSAPTSIR